MRWERMIEGERAGIPRCSVARRRPRRARAQRIGASLWFVLLAYLAAGLSGAGSVHAATLCPNEQVRAETSSTYLPDCRAYELVSPAYKEGHRVEPVTFTSGGRLAADGTHVIAQAFGALAGTEDVPLGAGISGATYELSRTASGWTATALTPPAPRFPFDFSYEPGQFVSADLLTTLWFLNTSPAEQREQTNQSASEELYLREPDGSFALMGPTAPSGQESNRPVEGVSSDLSHIFFTLDHGRWPGDTTFRGGEGTESLYQASAGAAGAEPRLVGVSNDAPLAGNAEAKLISQCGTGLAGWVNDPELIGPHASYPWVPANGHIALFKAFGKATRVACSEYESRRTEAIASCEQQEGKTTAECEEIRRAARTSCEQQGKPPAQCEGEFGPPLQAPEVGEFYARIDGEKTVAISEPSPPLCNSSQCIKAEESERSEAFFQGTSADGHRVFFTTTQPLVNGDTDTTNDLYMAEIAGEGRNAKLANLLQVSKGGIGDATPGSGAKVLGVSAVANDGSRVFLVAEGVLTTVPNLAGQVAPAGRPNLYAVEPANGRTVFLATLSASDEEADWATGAREVGLTPDGRFAVFRSGSGLIEYDAQTGALTTVAREGFGAQVASDGTVVFESSAALTPRALNDPTHQFHNIYEYRNGQLSLISDGHDVLGDGTQLLGIDASGENIYFRTYDQLVSQDTDTARDIYDARVDGGFPAVTQPAECSGDSCQGGVTAPPAPPTPASVTQAAGGNLQPAPLPAKSPPGRSGKARKLASTLKACRKIRAKHRRARCEARARARYSASVRGRTSGHPPAVLPTGSRR